MAHTEPAPGPWTKRLQRMKEDNKNFSVEAEAQLKANLATLKATTIMKNPQVSDEERVTAFVTFMTVDGLSPAYYVEFSEKSSLLDLTKDSLQRLIEQGVTFDHVGNGGHSRGFVTIAALNVYNMNALRSPDERNDASVVISHVFVWLHRAVQFLKDVEQGLVQWHVQDAVDNPLHVVLVMYLRLAAALLLPYTLKDAQSYWKQMQEIGKWLLLRSTFPALVIFLLKGIPVQVTTEPCILYLCSA